MELSHILYAVEVSKELNFSRAAANLHITQPTLSHQIDRLESEIGFALFRRSNRSVELTSAGSRFIE